jgi:hypothetical protein
MESTPSREGHCSSQWIATLESDTPRTKWRRQQQIAIVVEGSIPVT